MARISSLSARSMSHTGARMTLLDYSAEGLAHFEEHGEHRPLLGKDGTPAYLIILGADSDVAKRIDYDRQAEAQNRVYQQAMAIAAERSSTRRGRKTVKVDTTVSTTLVTAEDIAEQEQRALEKIVALTVGWGGIEDENDNPLEFSADAVRDLYLNSPEHRDDALQFHLEKENFFAD